MPCVREAVPLSDGVFQYNGGLTPGTQGEELDVERIKARSDPFTRWGQNECWQTKELKMRGGCQWLRLNVEFPPAQESSCRNRALNIPGCGPCVHVLLPSAAKGLPVPGTNWPVLCVLQSASCIGLYVLSSCTVWPFPGHDQSHGSIGLAALHVCVCVPQYVISWQGLSASCDSSSQLPTPPSPLVACTPHVVVGCNHYNPKLVKQFLVYRVLEHFFQAAFR